MNHGIAVSQDLHDEPKWPGFFDETIAGHFLKTDGSHPIERPNPLNAVTFFRKSDRCSDGGAFGRQLDQLAKQPREPARGVDDSQ